MYKVRKRPKGVAIVASVVVLYMNVPAMAESPVLLNRELPHMMVRVCPTLEDAQIEATLAYQLRATDVTSSRQAFQRNEKCRLVLAAVTPRKEELSIRPFETWTLAYDENGSEAVRAPSLGANTLIKVSFRPQQVKYYFGSFVMADGHEFSGWIEIPGKRYIESYLEDQKGQNRP
jgi:hypothetical protein